MKTLTMIAALVGAVVLAPMLGFAHTHTHTAESPAPTPDFRALAFEAGSNTEIAIIADEPSASESKMRRVLLVAAIAVAACALSSRFRHYPNDEHPSTARRGGRMWWSSHNGWPTCGFGAHVEPKTGNAPASK